MWWAGGAQALVAVIPVIHMPWDQGEEWNSPPLGTALLHAESHRSYLLSGYPTFSIGTVSALL